MYILKEWRFRAYSSGRALFNGVLFGWRGRRRRVLNRLPPAGAQSPAIKWRRRVKICAAAVETTDPAAPPYAHKNNKKRIANICHILQSELACAHVLADLVEDRPNNMSRVFGNTHDAERPRKTQRDPEKLRKATNTSCLRTMFERAQQKSPGFLKVPWTVARYQRTHDPRLETHHLLSGFFSDIDVQNLGSFNQTKFVRRPLSDPERPRGDQSYSERPKETKEIQIDTSRISLVACLAL